MPKPNTPATPADNTQYLCDPAKASLAQAEAVAAATFAQPPRIGEMIAVRVAAGLQLLNNETDLDFEPEADTLQTVTVNTLRRLAEGDLVRVA